MDSCICWYDIKKQGCTNEGFSSGDYPAELKDFSGKNHNMQLYNFAWSGMSGIGGYNWLFTDGDSWDQAQQGGTNDTLMLPTKYYLNKLVKDYNYTTLWRLDNKYMAHPGFYVKITNCPIGLNGQLLYYYWGEDQKRHYYQLHEGVNYLCESFANTTETNTWGGFYLKGIPLTTPNDPDGNIYQVEYNCVIEILPQYPNALVSDGVDDYGSAENFPLQDDFTIIAKRHRISNAGCLLSKRADESSGGAFLFEGQTIDEENGFVDSFGTRTQVNWAEDDIVYMTPTSYNGTPITKGTDADHNRLNLFMIYNNYFLSAALYKLLIFNRTLSDEEIQWVKHNLIEDVEDDYLVDAWFMSDYDNSDNTTGFTINGVKGTELTPKNFAFNGSSGFGRYPHPIDFFTVNGSSNPITFEFSFPRYSAHGTITEGVTESSISYGVGIEANTTYTFRVLIKKVIVASYNKGLSMWYTSSEGNQYLYIGNIINPGLYEVTFTTDSNSTHYFYVGYLPSYVEGDEIGYEFEILPTPETEGSLVFDGVDDYLINDPYTLPLLDDYTIICRREIENENTQYCVISKSISQNSGAFVFETGNELYNFGLNTVVPINKQDSISYQTKSSYNGTAIAHGTATDEKQFVVGIVRPNDGRFFKGNIKYIALYNKSLTPLQIEREINRLEEKWQSKLESRNSVSLTS